MKEVFTNIKIQVNNKIFVKDPETTVLGKKIIQESIIMIDEIGFENFTFKKLGEKIASNESSIYRYFESKHKLLVYLSSWYWGWMEYRLVFETNNIENPMDRLKKAITIVTEKVKDDYLTDYINQAILNQIIIVEFTKTLLTKDIDEENKQDYFLVYKRVIYRLVEMIEKTNPSYPFSKSLASTIVEGALHQHFLKNHLKTITDCNELHSPPEFYVHLIENLLK